MTIYFRLFIYQSLMVVFLTLLCYLSNTKGLGSKWQVTGKYKSIYLQEQILSDAGLSGIIWSWSASIYLSKPPFPQLIVLFFLQK